MFISRKELAAILERLDRLETIVASATGYNVEELKKMRRQRTGSRCPASSFGAHDYSGTVSDGVKNGKTVLLAYCKNCGQVLGA